MLLLKEERMAIVILKLLQCLKRWEVELVFEAECFFFWEATPVGRDPLPGRRCLKPCGSGSREAKLPLHNNVKAVIIVANVLFLQTVIL